MPKQCLKCGYVNQATDPSQLVECPECRIIYGKYESALAKKAAVAGISVEEYVAALRDEEKAQRMRSAGLSDSTESEILVAEFNPLIRPYLVLRVGVGLALTFILIPLAIIWFLGLGQWWARHYFDMLLCELDDKTIRFRKGILFQIERTIPLENIQDVTFIEGPLLKHFDLSTIKFETAGQSSGQANDMELIGIIDADVFRTRILERREAAKANLSAPRGATGKSLGDEHLELLRAIQAGVNEITTLMREKK